MSFLTTRPGQDCLGPDDACDLREGLAAQPLANLSQRPALSVAQGHAARDVRPENAVLRGEILVPPEELLSSTEPVM